MPKYAKICEKHKKSLSNDHLILTFLECPTLQFELFFINNCHSSHFRGKAALPMAVTVILVQTP